MDPIFFLCAEVREGLRQLPDQSIQACVTSPPYYGLRNYGLDPVVWGGGDLTCEHEWSVPTGYVGHRGSKGQVPQTKWKINETYPQHTGSDQTSCTKCGAWHGCLGLEPTVDLYIEHLVQVFDEVRRVLRDDGCLWVNIGDSYASTNPVGNRTGMGGSGLNCFREGYVPPVHRKDTCASGQRRNLGGLKAKDLCLVPFRLALAMQQSGWYVRSDVIWEKGSCMPESVKDRPTRSHEYLFLFTKSPNYYWDQEAVKESLAVDSLARNGRKKSIGANPDRADSGGFCGSVPGGRNVRTVWKINPKPFPGAHFAVFPPALPERCLRASTSEHGACSDCGAPYERVVEKGEPLAEWQASCGADSSGEYHGVSQKDYATAGAQDASATKARILAGMVAKRTVGWQKTCRCEGDGVVPQVVLDPFSGSGTTGIVAKQLGLRAVLIDQNPDYIEMSRKRCGLEIET